MSDKNTTQKNPSLEYENITSLNMNMDMNMNMNMNLNLKLKEIDKEQQIDIKKDIKTEQEPDNSYRYKKELNSYFNSLTMYSD